MAATSDEILIDLSPGLIVYKDGRIQRLFGTDLIPASLHTQTGTQSKDVEFAQNENLSVRIFLPKNATSGRKLPLFVYFHGGGFILESALSPTFTDYLNSVVSEANVVAISVNYRLAPEYPLPIAYQDSWLALKWVESHCKGEGSEAWLKEYADFDRVYLGGDSAGANIAHNLGIRARLEKLDGINIIGMFLNCPYFGGTDLIGHEPDRIEMKTLYDSIFLFAYPTCSGGLDDPCFNPAMNPELSNLVCKKVLIYVAEKDVLKDRGWLYKETLCKSGWVGDVEVVEVEGEIHVFNLYFPTGEKAISMMKKLAHFLNEV